MSQVRSRWYGIIVTLKRLAVPMLCPNLEDLSIQTLWQIIFYRNLLINFTIHLCCTSPSEKHLKDFETRERCCNKPLLEQNSTAKLEKYNNCEEIFADAISWEMGTPCFFIMSVGLFVFLFMVKSLSKKF